MYKRKFLCLIITLIFCLVSITGCNPEQILRYNLNKGDIYKYKVSTDLKMTMPLLGNEEIPMKMNYIMEQKVTDVKNNLYTIENILKDWEIEGIPAEESPPVEDLKITMKMDKQGNIKDIKSTLVDMNLNQNNFSQQMQIVYPKEPIVKNKPFVIKYTLPLPGIKEPLKTETTLTYQGDEKKQDIDSYKILAKTEIPLDMTVDQQGFALKMNGSEKIDATMFIDKKSGMPVETTGKVDMKITMKPVDAKNQSQGNDEKIDTTAKGTVKMVLVK